MINPLNKLIRKKEHDEKDDNSILDNDADKTLEARKSSRKFMYRYVLLFLLCAGAGFAVVSYLALDSKSVKKIPVVNSQFSNIAPTGQGKDRGSNVWLSGQAAQPTQAASNSTTIQARTQVAAAVPPSPVSTVTASVPPSTGGRDVFKEFYISHQEQSPNSRNIRDIGKTLDKFLPPLSVMPQPLPAVQALTPQISADQLKEIKISGTACVVDNDCVAITSEGTLKKGDKLGIETVLDINKTSFITTKRTLELN